MNKESLELKEILFDRIPKENKFEDKLWEAADNLRANARLKSSEYAAPLLGLFFLRYASNRFDSISEQALKEFEESQTKRNVEDIENVYKRLCGFYLPEDSRYETLLNLKDADNAQQSVIKAMTEFEKANAGLDIQLPKNDFHKIPDKTLREIIGVVSEITVAEGDVFGKVYEYFLGKFALSEGQKGGEFYTPTSVVKLIVEVIEPFKTDARVLDPACGTGGMFVQSAKFIERHVGMQNLSIYGQEKVLETTNLGKLNLFVNGLKGTIRNVNSSLSASEYTDEYADTIGKFDYVMANPPFNVDGVRLEDVGTHPLFASYGLPVSTAKSGKKSETFSNANYLWISLFAAALNATGRAGFVMANSASDARGGELEVRKNLVQAGMVDVMVSIASNFFYTVTLPVTLWFFDKEKTNSEHPRHDQTLFIDARKIFHQVSRSLREFTQAQLQNLASIVWLYRGENEKFAELKNLYRTALETWQKREVSNEETEKHYFGIAKHTENTAKALQTLGNALQNWFAQIPTQPNLIVSEPVVDISDWKAKVESLTKVTTADLIDKNSINKFYKLAEEVVLFADKQLRPEKDKSFNKFDLRGLLKLLGHERDDTLFVLERMAYFAEQVLWLETNFPEGVFRDVEGLCKIASRAEIEEQQFSLNSGRYVGVALEDDGMTEAEFREFMNNNAAELAQLHGKADELQKLIADDLKFLFMDAKAEAV
ncbi:MAG: type I restriction-modification system subunit M [Pyrinomonadaceae bacterium]|nr:type I restriction-modification system subunit M [Pyrinomonadaceae bacterium]